MLPRPYQKFIRLPKSYSIPYKSFSAYSKVPPPHQKVYPSHIRTRYIIVIIYWKIILSRRTKNCPARTQKSISASYSCSIHYGDHVGESELSRRVINCPVWALESLSACFSCSIHYGDHVGKSELSRKYLDRAFSMACFLYWTYLRFRGLYTLYQVGLIFSINIISVKYPHILTIHLI